MKKLTICALIFLIIFSGCSKKNINTAANIDLDFSKMNYNMLSSITFEMLVEPEKYIDKIAKIAGNYYTIESEKGKYDFVLIWDATGCCPAGLSFIPSDAVKEKTASLKLNQKITVTGVLKMENEGEDSQGIVLIAQSIE